MNTATHSPRSMAQSIFISPPTKPTKKNSFFRPARQRNRIVFDAEVKIKQKGGKFFIAQYEGATLEEVKDFARSHSNIRALKLGCATIRP